MCLTAPEGHLTGLSFLEVKTQKELKTFCTFIPPRLPGEGRFTEAAAGGKAPSQFFSS